MRGTRLLVLVALLALATAGASQAHGTAKTATSWPAPIGSDFNYGPSFPFAPGSTQKASQAARRIARDATPQARLGDRRLWPSFDFAQGLLYFKYYTLRGVGNHIEIWVASDEDSISKGLEFPAGDCRNDERVVITDAQIQYFVAQFEQNIFPKEAETFAIAPSRNGANAQFPADLGLPGDYFSGDGARIVTLVDNFRDGIFYNDPDIFPVAGFFDGGVTEGVDRNVMNVSGYDWLHLTGANPPNDYAPGDPCGSSPVPFFHEATFAHEYQHLLEYYSDPNESLWLNEGMSNYAQTLTGYVDPSKPAGEASDLSVPCLLGELRSLDPDAPGGPENSLSVWEDQGLEEISCDYGAAESMVDLLASRYGNGFISKLHRDPDNGLKSVRKLIRAHASKAIARDIVHDWATMLVLDGLLDQGWVLSGGPSARYTSSFLAAHADIDSPDAYSSPGAPPNGSDYVRLRDESGDPLSSRQIQSLSFDGTSVFPPVQVEWNADGDPPGHPGDSALYSGSGSNFDRAIVKRVSVPEENPVLTFDARWNTEPGSDYGFVQVSTNGGATYKSLANDDTLAESDPGAVPTVIQNLPGFTATSGAREEAQWVSEEFDLSAYRGKDDPARVPLRDRFPPSTFPGGDRQRTDRCSVETDGWGIGCGLEDAQPDQTCRRQGVHG